MNQILGAVNLQDFTTLVLVGVIVAVQKIVSNKIDRLLRLDFDIKEVKILIGQYSADISEIKTRLTEVENFVSCLKSDIAYIKGRTEGE